VDKNLREKMGSESRKIAVEKFDEKKLFSEWLKAYEHAVKELRKQYVL